MPGTPRWRGGPRQRTGPLRRLRSRRMEPRQPLGPAGRVGRLTLPPRRRRGGRCPPGCPRVKSPARRGSRGQGGRGRFPVRLRAGEPCRCLGNPAAGMGARVMRLRRVRAAGGRLGLAARRAAGVAHRAAVGQGDGRGHRPAPHSVPQHPAAPMRERGALTVRVLPATRAGHLPRPNRNRSQVSMRSRLRTRMRMPVRIVPLWMRC
jgi:hypothetical protein